MTPPESALIEQMESQAREATKSDPQLREHLGEAVSVGVYNTGFDPAMDEIYAYYCVLEGPPKLILGK